MPIVLVMNSDSVIRFVYWVTLLLHLASTHIRAIYVPVGVLRFLAPRLTLDLHSLFPFVFTGGGPHTLRYLPIPVHHTPLHLNIHHTPLLHYTSPPPHVVLLLATFLRFVLRLLIYDAVDLLIFIPGFDSLIALVILRCYIR